MVWGGLPSPRENSEKYRQKLIIALNAIPYFSPKVLTENKISDSFLKNEILSFVFCNE